MKQSFVEIAIDRVLMLLKEDDEFRQALIRLINGKAEHERWLAELAAQRVKSNERKDENL